MSPRPGGLVIRPLTPDDDLGPDQDLAERAFGPLSEAQRADRLAATRPAVAAGRHLGGFVGGAQVAAARDWDMRQWWHGRALPMAGVAGVKVAAHEQGRGLGRALMMVLLEQVAAAGYPLSALYPATAPLYRSLGWELAGGRYEAVIPARSLRGLRPPDPLASDEPAAAEPGPGALGSAEPAAAGPAAAGSAGAGPAGAGPAGAGPAGAGPGSGPDRGAPAFRPAGPADAAEIVEVLGRVYAAGRDCGPTTFDAADVARSLADGDYLYLAPDGVLSYRWNRAGDELHVACAAAGSAATARAMWSIVASHGTIADRVRVIAGPADPVTWLTAEPDVRLTRIDQWMLRLLDAPAAIAGRGFPAGVTASVPLTVTDPQLPANSGDWRLEVSGGAAALVKAQPEPDGAAGAGRSLRLGARGLSALYAGTPLATLRQAGLAAGGSPDSDAALDAAFSAIPYMIDGF